MMQTYKEILAFANASRGYLERVKGQKTKLAYAIERVTKGYAAQAEKLEAAYREKLADLDIEHCSTDERGNILTDGAGRYVYTKDAQRARLKRQREELERLLGAVVEVEPYFATALPDDLSDAEREALTGFVIKPGEEFTPQPNGGAELIEAGA
jgi:hypothetical protein